MTCVHVRSSVLVVAALVSIGLLPACKPKQETARTEERAAAPPPKAGPPCRASTIVPDPNAPDLLCPAPPSTFDTTAYTATNASAATMAQAGPAFDSWAWASFAAFNWPALASSDAATYPTGYVRGIPDVSQQFMAATGSEVVVWETFKEKREVFNNTVQTGQWQQLTYSPDQTISTQGGSVPACSPAIAQRVAAMPGGAHRRILQASKMPKMPGPHDLDETAEVSSPAQESQAALCAGYSGPALATCQTKFPVPPGGPAATLCAGLTDAALQTCLALPLAPQGNASTAYNPANLNPRPGVGPRVLDPDKNLVYYEVRVNYDYFNYVLANKLNFVNPPASPAAPVGTPAIQPPYSLPWRTSAPNPPNPGAQKQASTLSYESATTAKSYKTQPSMLQPIGSVQVKSAWKMLSAPDPTYHTTEAVYFTTTSAGTPCYSVTTFGLIGLHIIQRAHMGNSTANSNANTLGGTFIFATWEHNSIANGGGYSYVNFLANDGLDQPNPVPYPTVANAIPVQRQQQYPLKTTTGVTQQVYGLLPANSVWKNYRLIGTQFYANVTPSTSLQFNQPYYLANLVVETNNGLQNFQGLPPNITPNPNYGGFTASGKSYNPTLPNVAFNNQNGGPPLTMGGCMGCHGVAQLLGSNFSFVLLDGQRGASIDTASEVSIPPDPPPNG
jgi:hypothetical protein